MIAIGKPGMAHADAIRVNQSLIHQPQLLFGYGKLHIPEHTRSISDGEFSRKIG